MNQRPCRPDRRAFVAGGLAAAAGSGLLGACSRGGGRTSVKVGFVSPRTGPLAPFAEADDFIISSLQQRFAAGVGRGETKLPIELVRKDSQSDSNRASEVTAELIGTDAVDLVIASSTADTVNPVSDQCEVNGVPCLTTNAPWEAYYFGRNGTPQKGFDWTWHFFWGLDGLTQVYTDLWALTPTNRVVGALWPNDAEGAAFSNPQSGFPPRLTAGGFTLVDRGRFPPATADYSAQISAFKAASVEIVTGVLPPPAFATFWSQAAQQQFRPKIVTMAKALLFPTAVAALGPRAEGLSTEVWWSPRHPFKSGLTGQSSAELAAAYQQATGKGWTQPIGFQHALFEVAIDALNRCADFGSAEAIRDAIRQTQYNSIVGPVAWTGQPVANVCRTPLAGGQWSIRANGPQLALVSSGSLPNTMPEHPLQPL